MALYCEVRTHSFSTEIIVSNSSPMRLCHHRLGPPRPPSHSRLVKYYTRFLAIEKRSHSSIERMHNHGTETSKLIDWHRLGRKLLQVIKSPLLYLFLGGVCAVCVESADKFVFLVVSQGFEEQGW